MEFKKIRAIRHIQGNKEVYSLSIQGNEILNLLSIDRVKRDNEGTLQGYQRLTIKKHINEIKDYMNRSDAILPNAIVVCFDGAVKFEELQDGMGYLNIPTDAIHGFIVDGQQRSSALYEAEELKNKTFEVTVNAFIADDMQIQREQFMLVNNSKPLPKTLLNELMPNTLTALPKAMEEKRVPNLLIQTLNRNPHSAFYSRIKTHTSPDGYIAENSLLLPIKDSLEGNGFLYYLTSHSTGNKENNIDDMLSILDNFFKAVSQVWSEDFNSKPKDTRLTHGGGIKALFGILDNIEARLDKDMLSYSIEDFKNILEALELDWKKMLIPLPDGSQISIMNLQNNKRDKSFLYNHITNQFRAKEKHGCFK